MTFTRHAGLRWLLVAGLLLALALILLSSRAAAANSVAQGRKDAGCGGTIKIGDQTSDWIQRAGEECVYRFAGLEGQEVTVAMLGISLDSPDVLLLDDEGLELDAEDCAKPVEPNARTRPTAVPTPTPVPLKGQTGTPTARLTCYLPADGTYQIVASRDPDARTRATTGQYVLNLCGTHIASPYNETLKRARDGEIERKGLACYSFEAEAGDCVTTAMNKDVGTGKNTLDPWLDLRDPSGAIVASDDNSNGDEDALIRNFCLKKPGLYTIIARSYDFSGAGPFSFYFALEEGAARTKERTTR